MIVRGLLALVLAVFMASGMISPPSAESAACRYNVTPDASQGIEALALDVTVDCDRPIAADRFRFGYSAEDHVTWRAGKPLRCRMMLGDLARSQRPIDFSATDQGVLAPVDAWLAAPIDRSAGDTLEVTFARPKTSIR
jgi:hypothetical protein